MDALILDLTLKQINTNYRAGTLEWMRETRPADWKKMVDLEGKINRLVKANCSKGTRAALKEYESHIARMVKDFGSHRRK